MLSVPRPLRYPTDNRIDFTVTAHYFYPYPRWDETYDERDKRLETSYEYTRTYIDSWSSEGTYRAIASGQHSVTRGKSYIHDMRAALSSVLSIGTGNRVKLSFQDQRLVFQCAGDCVSASAPIEVIALTGAPAGDYWFNAKQLVTCLKALSGTVTLGIAQGGMLTLATQDAYYLQNAMRPEAQKKTQKAAQPAAAKAA